MTPLVSVALLGILTSASPAEDPRPVTAAEALKQVGKPEVLVEMVVRKAKDRIDKRGIVYLDSEADFKDPNNLGVALSAAVAARLRQSRATALEAYFQGKTIRVRGCVMRFEERAYLPVLDPAQIQIVGTR
ncbi:MAG: hypothetical protein U0835_15425 [Isosphaeraceae bacterium]